MKGYLSFIFLAGLFFGYHVASGQVVVVAARGGTSICSNSAVGGSAPAPTVMDTIMIRETHLADFATGNDSLVLKPPTGWKFWTGIGAMINYAPLSGDFGTDFAQFGVDSIVIGLSMIGGATIDTQWAWGFEVQAQSPTAAPGYIYASRIVGSIAGIVLGPAGTDFGDLSLSPAAITGSSNVCITTTTSLSDASMGGTWSSKDATIATVDATTGVVTGVATGTDTIIYTMPSGCLVKTAITVISCPDGVNNVSGAQKQVTVYPNPVGDELTINMVEGVYQAYRITNAIGQVVMEQQLNKAQTHVNVKSVLPGMYFLALKGETEHVVLRFHKL